MHERFPACYLNKGAFIIRNLIKDSGDIQFVERKLAAGEKYLKRLPSEYLWENVRFSTQPICIPDNEEHFASLLEMSHAEETFCYSSDWPHATYDETNWVVEHPRSIPLDFQKKILSENAKAMFTRVS